LLYHFFGAIAQRGWGTSPRVPLPIASDATRRGGLRCV
jgi:hypothetical protein